MQLLYLYIGGRERPHHKDYYRLEDTPYKVLKNVKLNFSNEFLFNFDDSIKKLTLENNNDYVPNFYDTNNRIQNITGIIGKNGTGKSSILEIIKLLQDGDFEKIHHKIIAIFSESEIVEKKRVQKEFTIFHHPDLEFEVDTQVKELKLIFQNSAKVSIRDIHEAVFPKEIKIIFYNNLFEINPVVSPIKFNSSGRENYEDISTSSLLQSDSSVQTNHESQNINADTLLRRHQLMETERQVEFLLQTKNSGKQLDFKLPSWLELSIDHFDESTFTSRKENPYSSLIHGIEQYKPTVGSTAKEFFCYFLHRAALFNIIRYFNNNSGILDININAILDNNLNRSGDPKKIREFFNYLASAIRVSLKKNGVHEDNPISNQLDDLVDFLVKIIDIPENRFNASDSKDPKLYLDVLNTLNTFEFTILNDYFQFKTLTGFIVLDWRFDITTYGQMSSGQKSLLNIYSRFYSVHKNAMKFDKKNRFLLILMDEADQLFHPEWQRTFFNNFLLIFDETFDFAESIQIIMTSHSPFIASDLPPFSVIKLDKDDLFTKVIPQNQTKSTFAANIHELFTDSFYLENGLIGEFAKTQITQLLDDLNTKDLIKNFERNLKIINLIGEPYIKDKFYEILLARIKENPVQIQIVKQLQEISRTKEAKKWND